MESMKLVVDLKAWLLSHYEEGGHWIYETYSDEELEAALKNGFKSAKKKLKAHWELIKEQESNCAWDGPGGSAW